MKHFFILLILLLTSTLSFASSDKNGGFGGPVIKTTQIYNSTTLMLGAKGAYLIDHSFYVGGSGYAVTYNNEYESITPAKQKYHFGYIGGILGYIFTPSKDFHLNTQLLLGSAITFLYDPNSEEPIDLNKVAYGFVSEAEIGALYDVNKYLKMEFTLGYRYVHPNEYFRSKDLNGYSLNLGFLFGKY